MTQAWHGLSHKQAWGDLGDSYADLNESHARHAVTHAADSVGLVGAVAVRQPAAGVQSAARLKGAGTFQLQVSFEVLTRVADASFDSSEDCRADGA